MNFQSALFGHPHLLNSMSNGLLGGAGAPTLSGAYMSNNAFTTPFMARNSMLGTNALAGSSFGSNNLPFMNNSFLFPHRQNFVPSNWSQ